ncbi:MAG: serine/threonine-protein kinase [bacterium]
MENLKNYRIKGIIAHGGMSTIYRGEQISLERDVVIKKLHPHLAADSNFVERFKREAAILANLQHKNIVNIIDFFEENKSQYIVLEYIKGMTLDSLIEERGSIPYSTALYILQEVTRGLKYIHSNSILHRDLKPDNIMISADGEIKITDFGLAYRNENMKITNPGTYLGTPAYFPPEQLTGKPLTPASDIFSLGVSFVEMLTGENPFRGKEEFETINNILYHKSVEINITGEGRDNDIVRLIHMMLEKDPDKRISDCDKVLSMIKSLDSMGDFKEFNAYIEGREIASDEEAIEFDVHIVKRTEPFKVIALLILIIIFLGISIAQIYFYFGSREPERIYISSDNDRQTLRIITEPPGINVSLNDSIVLRSPALAALSPGKYRISVDNVQYEPYDTVINFTGPDTVNISLKELIVTQDYGYLSLNINPWADLYINNVFIDRTPLQEPVRLETGRHVIELRHPNRVRFIDTIEVVKDSIVELNRNLDKAYGYLRIIVRPWADVYIDDSLYGITPMADSIKLLTGPHAVKLVNPQLGEIEDEINIVHEEVLRKVYSY